MKEFTSHSLLDSLKDSKGVSKDLNFYLTYLFAVNQQKGFELFTEKNKRYESSFFKQCAEDGDLSSVTVRLSDKVNRFKSLVKNPDLDPLDESIRDTLVDLANYATMSLAYLDLAEQCNDKPRGDITNASE